MSVVGLLWISVLLGAGATPAAVVPLEVCSQGGRTSGECLNITSTIDAGGVAMGATGTIPGSPGGQTSSPGQASSSGQARPVPWRPAPVRNPVLGSAQCTVIIAGSCRGQSPPRNPPAPAVTVVAAPIPPTSVSDLASFSPRAPGIVVEPGAWSIPRVTTNIFAVASTETQRGELLGWPIEVRFSPQVFRWNYGDGSRGTHAVPGRSWGSAQFSTTATGHVFRAPGRYLISVEVDYAVAYRFEGGAFVALSGVVTRSTGPVALTVLRVTPVLVADGCGGKALVGGRCE